jgi:subtilisin-like proprotein convertase family protein
MLNGYSSFSGTSLKGTYTEATSGNTYTNTDDYSIPDNNSTGISSPINVTDGGNASSVSVDVNIQHTYIGDLTVDLIDPAGGVYNLHNRSGGSANDINKTYSVNVGNANRVGIWNLRVRDSANIDTGIIDSWSITL